MQDEGIEVGGDILPVAGVVNRHMPHSVASGLQVRGKGSHRSEDGQHLLCVVAHVVCFRTDFHQQVDDVSADLTEPRVLRV